MAEFQMGEIVEMAGDERRMVDHGHDQHDLAEGRRRPAGRATGCGAGGRRRESADERLGQRRTARRRLADRVAGPFHRASRCSRRPCRSGRRQRPARQTPVDSAGARSRRRSPRAISRSRASSAARRSGVSKTPASVSRLHTRSTSGRAAARIAPIASGAGGADEIVRVLARRAAARSAGSCRAASCGRARSAARWAARRPGLVAVEAEDRLVGHAPEDVELALGERGAERRHRVGEAGRRPCG